MRTSHNVVIVGFGNMGKALARGLQRSSSMTLHICDKFPQPSARDLQERGLDAKSLHWISSAQSQSAQKIDFKEKTIFILATKPKNLVSVIDEWRTTLQQHSQTGIVISILAGIPTEVVENLIGKPMPVVRAMPNIAATVDHAATVICAGKHASEADLEEARAIFDAVGKTWITPEDMLNAVTGLSGSGPGYIYMIIEALSDGGVKMGLSRELSLELATQTVIGAGILVRETKTHPAILRDQVATPAGTTISAIHELERHGLRAMLIQAVVTATRKSARLLDKTLSQFRP